MFEDLRKTGKKELTDNPDAVTCPSCKYIRKVSDKTPDWQCPGCGVAYHKVTEKYKTEVMSKEKEEFQKLQKERARESHNRTLVNRTTSLMFTGYIAAALGFSTTCFVDPSFLIRNPVIGVLGVSALTYGLYYIYKNWKNRADK